MIRRDDVIAIHCVAELDLTFRPAPWPFAEQRRADIDRYFAAQQAFKPQLWNGPVLLLRDPVFTATRFSAQYFETDFASFLAWRDWSFPDKTVFNGFGMGALRGSDGAFALGEMAAHTANAGRIYFPSGTPEPGDLKGDIVDIAGSVAREVAEETGLQPGDYRAAEHWHCVVSGSLIAMMRILDAGRPASALRDTIEATIASQSAPELTRIHLVRDPRDYSPAMPPFVTAFIDHMLAMQDI